jgi:Zn-dependent peptidase ImmA (M78 family)/transcriptional regulator with XRE-family HTH domain
MDAEISDRVRATVTELGLSSRQFAERIGLDEDKLSKSLKGIRRFSPLELASISEVSGKSTDWYLTGVEPRQMGIAARADASAASAIEDIGASLAGRFANAQDVLLGLGRGRIPPALPNVLRTSRFVGEGQAMAKWATGLISEDALLGDSREFVMALEEAFFVDVATVNELPEGCDGLSFQDDSFRLILLSATTNWTRKRFTLAHELGHILWGDARHKILTESVSPGAETDYLEKRANAFAGAFLMSDSSIEATVGDQAVDEHLFHELVMRYKVSPSAMAARLVQLGQITRNSADTFKRLSTQQSAAALDRVVESVTESAHASIVMPPSAMLLQFIGAYIAREVGAKPLVALTGLSAKEIRAMFNEEGPAPVVSASEPSSSDEEELAFQP